MGNRMKRLETWLVKAKPDETVIERVLEMCPECREDMVVYYKYYKYQLINMTGECYNCDYHL